MIAIAALLVLGVASTGDALVLREQARVGGRWVRLLDLVDADRSGPAACQRVGEVWLGRSPEEGSARIITVVEIHRELERRGLDPASFEIRGGRVEVIRGPGLLESDPLRLAVASQIKRHLMGRDPSLTLSDLSVRIVTMHPESIPAGFEPSGVSARGAGFSVTFTNAARVGAELLVEARISRKRDVAFAARDIHPGKVIERGDLEIRPTECSGEEGYSVDPGSLQGSTAAVRIQKGSPLNGSDLRPKPVVRKGDVVRAYSSSFEVDVRVLAEGSPGQEIDAEFLASQRRLRVRVVDATRVNVAGEGR